MAKLSILIPARNEEFLQRTIDDVFEHAEGDTEVVVGLDGSDEGLDIEGYLQIHPMKVHFEHNSIGQRAMTNKLAKIATGKYLMKLDAHCSMSQGFDVKMMEDMADNTVIVPAITNLHAYDWVCPQGHRHFQGKYDKCSQCGSTDLKKDIKWQIIPKPIRSNFCFDSNLHFQYAEKDLPELLTETMSIQGSCFMANRDDYFRLNLCDEAFGSWGQQGVEVACKTWLSGGRVLCTKKAFYGHQFRETEGFPYENKAEDIFAAQKFSKDLFLKNNWPLAKYNFAWLIEKFGYPQDWTPERLKELSTNFVDK